MACGPGPDPLRELEESLKKLMTTLGRQTGCRQASGQERELI